MMEDRKDSIIVTESENSVQEKTIENVIKESGGTIEGEGILPDKSGFIVASYPLPETHWLYEEEQEPPMPLMCGVENPIRQILTPMMIKAAKYAVRSATGHGKIMDFDPDALVQNLLVGMFGYYTKDGRSVLKGEW